LHILRFCSIFGTDERNQHPLQVCVILASVKLNLNFEVFLQKIRVSDASKHCSHADMGWLHHKCNRLRLLATCSITITNKQNYNVIDCDYIESNHDYNPDYMCLETSSEQKQNPFAWFVSIFSDNIRCESMQ